MKETKKRVFLILLDSVGIGELPDAAEFGDVGTNTLANTAKAVGGLNLPSFQKLGLGNIHKIEGVPAVQNPVANWGKMAEKSKAKDTTTGHWEIAGLVTKESFSYFPDGFPEEIIEAFKKISGRPILGNKAASGTDIIQEFGMEHIKTGALIVYTSADSVFQIAAHEQIVPLEELYRICRETRIMLDKYRVGRVIARPFVGSSTSDFERTYNRKDFSMQPPGKTLLNYLKEAGNSVIGIGKIEDIFAGSGVTESLHTEGNKDGLNKTIKYMKTLDSGFVFTNLVDFDMLWGHRNDFKAYAKGLELVDSYVPEILQNLKQNDMLIFTADHGCDPTTPGTDHTREHVPLLVYGNTLKNGVNLGIRETFSDLGQTIADYFGINSLKNGISFLNLIKKQE